MKAILRALLPLLVLLAALPARAGGLPPPVADLLKAARIPPAQVAVVVQPVDGRRPLVSHNAGQAMNPASVMKLLTTQAALHLLGPAHTWKTGALIDTEPVDGRLPGNLYLRGDGDPKLALEHFSALLRQLRLRGIARIDGDVVIDRAAFALPPPAGDFDDKPLRPYNVGPDALLVNFRTLRFIFVPEAAGARILLETPGDGLRLDNRLQLTSEECGDDWKERMSLAVRPEGSGAVLEFSGSYSARCGERALSLAPLPADAQVGSLFAALWREQGGSLGGRVRAGAVPAGARRVAEQESLPLADLVRDINKFSNNVMARQLYLALGREIEPDSSPAGGRERPPATPERARQRILAWLAGRGLDFRELELENGSGLSRRERISAGSVNRLLLDAWHSPLMPEFLASLPIAGGDGTMRRRLAGSPAAGLARIKTGTLEGVKSAAGYVQDQKGRRYAVTFLINHPHAREGQAAIDALLLWVAERGR